MAESRDYVSACHEASMYIMSMGVMFEAATEREERGGSSAASRHRAARETEIL